LEKEFQKEALNRALFACRAQKYRFNDSFNYRWEYNL